MVTQDINFDEDFNSISLEAQLLFIRCLTIADDCGVFPANDFTLQGLMNCPEKLKKIFGKCFGELTNSKLLIKFNHAGKQFFCFKKESWEENQKYLIKNRTRSEYLKIELQQFLSLYSKLQEIPVNVSDNDSYPIISKEIKIEIKDKEEDKEKIDFKKIPPILEDVKSRIKERELKIDAQYFIDYYAARDWTISKSKIKNWDSCLSTWAKNNYQSNSNNGKSNGKPVNDIQDSKPSRVL